MSTIDTILQTKENEEIAFNAYRKVYIKQNPLPVKKTVNGIGWQFWISLPVTLAEIVVAALRTADIFYKAALLSGMGDLVAIIEAAAVMLAIEGGLVVYSAIRASNIAKGKNLDQLKSYDNRLFWGILFMVIVSILAGLGQSISLIENINQAILTWFQYILSIIIGVGASVIAWIGGEVLGIQIAKVGITREEADKQYNQAMENYADTMRNSWNGSIERRAIRAQISIPESENFSENFLPQSSTASRTFPKDMPRGMPVHEKDWRKLRDVLTVTQLQWILDTDRKTVADVFEVNHRTVRAWKENIVTEGLLDS